MGAPMTDELLTHYLYIMKKSFIAGALIASSMLVAAPASAQIHFGVKAGLNVTNFDLSNIGETVSVENRCGWFVGATADFTLPLLGFAADAAVQYEHREYGIKDFGTESLNYVAIPINLKKNIGLSGIGSLYLATGPQFSFNMSGKKFAEVPDGDNTKEPKYKSAEISWNFGAGIKIASHYQLGYNYNLHISKSLQEKINNADITISNNTHQIAFTYWF